VATSPESAAASRSLGGQSSDVVVGRLLAGDAHEALLQQLLRDPRRRTLAAFLRSSGADSAQASHRELKLLAGHASADFNASASGDAVDINTEITEARWALDQKIVECRARPVALRAFASRASADVGELAGELSQLRGIILQSAQEYPEDREWLQNLIASTNRGTHECEKVEQLQTAQAEALEKELKHVAQMRASVAGYCDTSLAQLAPSQRIAVRRRLAALGASTGGRAVSKGGAPRGPRQHALLSRRQQWPSAEICARSIDSVDELEGELKDKSARLEAERKANRQACRDDRTFEQRQMTLTSYHKNDVARKMSEATSRLGGITERTRLKDDMRANMNSKVLSVEKTCRDEVDALLHKLCNLQQVRDQMSLAAGKKELPQDCEVTEWRDGVCSTSCGGGARSNAREVLILASLGGAACPPLRMTQPCSEEECPEDCETSAWSGWSSCSARCDGGFQERIRSVTVQPNGGGVSCGNLVSVRACNSRACDRDCMLAEWSTWSLCSLPCDGGSQERHRKVERRALGSGFCPAAEAGERLERQPCNDLACPEASNVRCHGAPVDLVLLVDASGSVGAQGVASFKKLALELARRYPLGATASRVAVATFADEAHIVSGLEGDLKVLEGKLNSGMSWTRGASMLSRGLALANTVLVGSRKEAAPIVLVLTDGRVSDPFLAAQVSARIRGRGTRLLFAVAGRGKEATTLFERLSSQPARENVIFVPSFAELEQNLTAVAGSVLQRTCSSVGVR